MGFFLLFREFLYIVFRENKTNLCVLYIKKVSVENTKEKFIDEFYILI